MTSPTGTGGASAHGGSAGGQIGAVAEVAAAPSDRRRGHIGSAAPSSRAPRAVEARAGPVVPARVRRALAAGKRNRGPRWRGRRRWHDERARRLRGRWRMSGGSAGRGGQRRQRRIDRGGRRRRTRRNGRRRGEQRRDGHRRWRDAAVQGRGELALQRAPGWASPGTTTGRRPRTSRAATARAVSSCR